MSSQGNNNNRQSSSSSTASPRGGSNEYQRYYYNNNRRYNDRKNVAPLDISDIKPYRMMRSRFDRNTPRPTQVAGPGDTEIDWADKHDEKVLKMEENKQVYQKNTTTNTPKVGDEAAKNQGESSNNSKSPSTYEKTKCESILSVEENPESSLVETVKVKPQSNNFYEFKKKALNLWNSGYNLQLDEVNKSASKDNGWLIESEYFSEKQSAVLKLESLSNLNLNQNSEETGHQLLTSALDKPRATYYEESSQQSEASNNSYDDTKMEPFLPPYNAYLPPLSEYDEESFKLLHRILQDHHAYIKESKLQIILESVLEQESIHEMAPRTVAILLEAISVILHCDHCDQKLEVSRTIFESWHSFTSCLIHHVQSHARSPKDLLIVLSVASGLVPYSYNNIQTQIVLPMTEILYLYNNLKSCCAPGSLKECAIQLKLLDALPSDDEFLRENKQ